MGDVLVHLPRTLDYAGPNVTDVPPNAWIIHFGPFGLLAKLRPQELWVRLLRRFDR
jgi:hypothetical protein